VADLEKESIIAEIEKWENLFPDMHGKLTIEINYRDGQMMGFHIFPKEVVTKVK